MTAVSFHMYSAHPFISCLNSRQYLSSHKTIYFIYSQQFFIDITSIAGYNQLQNKDAMDRIQISSEREDR